MLIALPSMGLAGFLFIFKENVKMKFNPTVEVYKSVPKEKLTAEYFKTNPIPLDKLFKR